MAKMKKGNKPGIRRVGRTLAFQVLYGTLFAERENPETVETAFDQNPLVLEASSETACQFARDLVIGVDRRTADVDKVIEAHSQHWKIERIAKVELSILRLSLYEMLYTDIPLKAVINEGIELSKKFGDEKSRGFINGILDGVANAIADGKYDVKKSF